MWKKKRESNDFRVGPTKTVARWVASFIKLLLGATPSCLTAGFPPASIHYFLLIIQSVFHAKTKRESPVHPSSSLQGHGLIPKPRLISEFIDVFRLLSFSHNIKCKLSEKEKSLVFRLLHLRLGFNNNLLSEFTSSVNRITC
jgi:hypothetical protein